MIAVDATPLVLPDPGGVARALRTVLGSWIREPPPGGVTLLAPGPLPVDLAGSFPVVTLDRMPPRRFRRRLGGLLEVVGADVLYTPFAAFPRTKIPVVSAVHEVPSVRLGAIEGPLRTLVHRRWLALGVRSCAAIVVPSEATRADVLAVHREAETKVHHVPNGFDPEPWERAGREAPSDKPPLVVAVGTGHGAAGHRKKGMDVLLAAWRHVHTVGARLAIAGELRARVPTGVEVHPSLDDDALRPLVASARVLVHPAWSEGFGYPVLEAMAAGTLVVTTDGGALVEIAKDAALVCAAGDVDGLASLLDLVLQRRRLFDPLVEKGRLRARAFDPAETGRRLLAVLDAVRGAT